MFRRKTRLPCVSLDHVFEVGLLVASKVLLFIRHGIPLGVHATGRAKLVLAAEHDVHEYGAAEQAEDLVAEDDTMAHPVPGLLVRDVDVGGDHAVEVAPADDHADNEGALERALSIVVNPCERVRDGRVDAHGAEECTGVLYARVIGSDQHDEAHDAYNYGRHIAEAALPGLVRVISDDDRDDGAGRVGRDGE